METSTCLKTAWRRQLTAYVDGELAPRDVAEVRAHLDGCARCRAAVALDRRMARALGTLPAWEAPAELTPAILARTVGAPVRGYRRVARWIPVLRIAVPSMLVLAMLVVLKVGGVFQAAASFCSIVGLEALRTVAGYLDHTTDTLDPLAKAAQFGHTDRILVEVVRAVVQAPTVEMAAVALISMLLFVLVAVRIFGSRTSRGVGHAAVFV